MISSKNIILLTWLLSWIDPPEKSSHFIVLLLFFRKLCNPLILFFIRSYRHVEQACLTTKKFFKTKTKSESIIFRFYNDDLCDTKMTQITWLSIDLLFKKVDISLRNFFYDFKSKYFYFRLIIFSLWNKTLIWRKTCLIFVFRFLLKVQSHCSTYMIFNRINNVLVLFFSSLN